MNETMHDFEADDRCVICGQGPDAGIHNGTADDPAPEGNHDYTAVHMLPITEDMVIAACAAWHRSPARMFDSNSGEENRMREALEAALTASGHATKMRESVIHAADATNAQQSEAISATAGTPGTEPAGSGVVTSPPICSLCGKRMILFWSGPIPGCYQGITSWGCPDGPQHKSQ